MNDLMNFLTSKEIIVVYIVVAVACLLCYIIYLFDKNYYKRKRKQNTRELNKLVEDINDELNKVEQPSETSFYMEPVIEKVEEPAEIINEVVVPQVEEVKADITVEPMAIEVSDKKEEPIIINSVIEEESIETLILESIEEELTYTDIEPNKTEAQEELQRLTEALEKAEEETRNIDLTSFEEEQEQNAIISLDELMAKSKTMYENNEFAKFEDEGDEPISLQDLELQMNTRKEESVVEPIIIEEKQELIEAAPIEPIQEKMILDEFNNIKIEEPPVYKETKKFKTSPVISPVFGIERKEEISVNELELENTANYEKLDEEIKKTNEFLMTLKELQSKLD